MSTRLLKYARNFFSFIATIALLVTLSVSHNGYSEKAFYMCALTFCASVALAVAMEMFILDRKEIYDSLTEVSA